MVLFCRKCGATSVQDAKFCGECGVKFVFTSGTAVENVISIRYFTYSAILDSDTCDFCRSLEDLRAERIEDLPPTPNPQCVSNDMCRCFIVGVSSAEGEQK